jgi:hypothetical protein
MDVLFEKKTDETGKKGTLVINTDMINDRKPEYYIHFTVGKFKDGFYRSLDYETDPVMQKFPARTDIAEGSYLMVTGNRITGGTVLANLTFFNIESGKSRETAIVLRKNPVPRAVLGNMSNPSGYIQSGTFPVNLSNGLIMAWMEPDKEPSRHFTADMIKKRNEFGKWKGSIVFLFKSEGEKTTFIMKNKKDLSPNIKFEIYTGSSLADLAGRTGKKTGHSLPVIVYANPKGEITYLSEGYKIGVGDELLQLIAR